MLPSSLPATPEEITPAWLSVVLRSTGVLRREEIVQATWERLGAERGLTGVLARFSLHYAEPARKEALPSSLIAKFPTMPPDSTSTASGASQQHPEAVPHSYERGAREVRFYHHLAPHSPIPTPHLYYGAVDEATGRIVLLLEDLSTARPGDVLRGCSPEEAERVLHAITPFHARWWAQPPLGDSSWLPNWVGNQEARQERYTRQVGPFLQRFGHQLPPSLHETIDRLRTDYVRVLTRLAGAPATLIHADLHLDNMLFSPSDRDHPVTILDWQSISWGAAAVDVALFLFGSLSTNQRRAQGLDLLAHYHRLLVDYGVSGYSFQQLLDDCRLALLWLLAGTVGWLSSVDLEQVGERERALMEAALGDGKLIAALQDTDAQRALEPK